MTEEIAAQETHTDEMENNLGTGVEVSVDTNQTSDREESDPIRKVLEKYGNDSDKLAEAYMHAQKKISEGQYSAPKAPEEYDFKFEVEGLEDGMIDKDDPLLTSMVGVFKDANLPQETADKLVNAFVEYEMSQAPDPAVEKAKLGKNAEDILGRLSNFSLANLEGKDREIFDSMTASADNVNLLNKIIGLSGEQSLAPNNPAVSAKSSQEYMDEAFAYKAKHGDSLSFDKSKQDFYEGLMKKGLASK